MDGMTSNSPDSHQSTSAIEVVDLHKSFRNGRDKILRGVNLKFPHGKLTYILGPSGTGKSVLIKHILGLLKPDSGKVLLDGLDITQLKGRELVEYRQRFGMLFQNAALFDDLTVYDNVAFPLYEHEKFSEEEIRTRVVDTLKQLGMPASHDKFPNELSGGMRKRVGLARAIIRRPSILFYDEPTTGLDPVTRTVVDDLIAHLKSELQLTSIVISHDIPSALRLADQIAFIFQGEIIFLGKSTDFKNCQHPKIQEFVQAETKSAQYFLH